MNNAYAYELSFVESQSDLHKDLTIQANSTQALDGVLGSLQNTTTWSQTHKDAFSSSSGDLFLVYDQVAFSTNPTRRTTTASPLFNASMPLDDPELWKGMNITAFFTGNPGDQRSGWLPAPSVDNGPTALHIEHAYTIKTDFETSLEISLIFMLIVVVFNIMKIAAMYTAFQLCSDDHFITIGDAVASYLKRPDHRTEGYCTLSQQDFALDLGQRELTAREKEKFKEDGQLRNPSTWKVSRRRLLTAMSSGRQLSAIFL